MRVQLVELLFKGHKIWSRKNVRIIFVFVTPDGGRGGRGGGLLRILDRGVPRRFVNPNLI